MVIISFILYYQQSILLILFAFVILGYLVIVNERLKLIVKHLKIDDQSFWKVAEDPDKDEKHERSE